MIPEILPAIGSSGQRALLLQQLQSELKLAQAALLASDWRRIEIHNARQLELCRLLQAVPRGTKNQTGENVGRETPAIVALAKQVLHLNRINALLLQYQQRTLRILICLLARSAPTYTGPVRRQSVNASHQPERPESARLTTEDRRPTTAEY